MRIEGGNLILARQFSAAKPGGTAAQAESKTRQSERADVLSLSQEARKAALEQIENLRRQLLEAKKQSDDTYKNFDAVGKCLTIAMRMMNGDKVPFKDQQFLKRHQPEMYVQAILLRRKNDNPKDHRSVLRCDNRRRTCSYAQKTAMAGKALEMLSTDDGQCG